MSSKYNIYRIKKSQEDALISKLTSEHVGLSKISERDIEGFKFRFYFSDEPEAIDIWWLKTYEEFFGDREKPKNRLYFGLLLISNAEILYAVSLGKSHFYLKNFCDPDFGLNLAQRIADQEDFRIKNSKFYKSRKSKTITTYQKGSKLDYDGGESLHYLKAKTIDKNLWGNVASFGNSVQLALDTVPSELHNLVKQIEDALNQPVLFEIPKAIEVRDEAEIKRLDDKLVTAIENITDGSNLTVDEFSVSGVDFIFSDRNNYKLYLKGDIDTQEEVGEISIGKLRRWVHNCGINLQENLNNIFVNMSNEYGKGHSQPLKSVLDFVDDVGHYCLIDGKWQEFNLAYLSFLKAQVDTIEIAPHEPKWDIALGVNEAQFNNARETDGFIQSHTVLQTLDNKYKWEPTDLYRDETLFFVKIGTPQKLGYVIDQSIGTVKILQQNVANLEEQGMKVKNICLWIILKRQPINKLSDIESLIFLMKLVDWKKTVINAGLQPLLYVNYSK